MLHDVGKRSIDNGIQTKSAQRYACVVIQCVNIEEEQAEGHKQRTRTGKIQFSGLSHKREKKCDPRLAWFMFHNIYRMYSDLNNKEE